MPILVFQHSDICTPGRLGATLRDHGFGYEVRRPDKFGVDARRGVPTDLDDVHGIVIMGGPQNVTDIAKYDWMQQEAKLIQMAHARELPIIGICLGCQLIAHALGGTVEKREKASVGFYPVSLTPPGQTDTVLAGIQWNHQQYFSCGQEVKTLPPGATLLISSKHTKHVAYKVGVRTFGFMNHFECDRDLIESINHSSKDDMSQAGVTEGELKVQLDQCYDTFARISNRLCVNLASTCFPLARRMTA